MLFVNFKKLFLSCKWIKVDYYVGESLEWKCETNKYFELFPYCNFAPWKYLVAWLHQLFML